VPLPRGVRRHTSVQNGPRDRPLDGSRARHAPRTKNRGRIMLTAAILKRFIISLALAAAASGPALLIA